MKKYYCNENQKIYDEQFNEVGSYKYTNEVEGLTRITKDRFRAELNFCDKKDASGWYIITVDVPEDAMVAAAKKVHRETEGRS